MYALTTWAIVALASQAGLQTYGQVRAGGAAAREGRAARRAAESQGELADYNAAVADLRAADAVSRGREEEGRWRAQVRTLIGGQRADYAASNVDVGYGSTVDVQADAAYLGELDALTIRQNARLEAWGYEVEAVDWRQRAAIARKEGIFLEAAGRERRTAAYLGAAGSIAGGATSLLMARYGFTQTAPTPTPLGRLGTQQAFYQGF